MPDKAMFARGKSGYGLLARLANRVASRYLASNTLIDTMHHKLRYSAFIYDICNREGKTCVLLEAIRLPKNRYPHDIHRDGLAHG